MDDEDRDWRRPPVVEFLQALHEGHLREYLALGPVVNIARHHNERRLAFEGRLNQPVEGPRSLLAKVAKLVEIVAEIFSQ